MVHDDLISLLQHLPGSPKLLKDSESLAAYGVDRTTQWQPAPACVVFPESVEQVQQLVHAANTHNFTIVPSGGRTGLSGGAVAARGEVVVSLERMDKILAFDDVARAVTVQAGVVTQVLQEAAASRDLFYPVDFAAAGSSQIGGNIATNAGGIRVIRYGMTRDWVLGLKVVTGSGDILEFNQGLVKNNSGFDFRHLFCGAEGTLGIICEATLQLTRPPSPSQVMLLAVSDFDAVMTVFSAYSKAVTLTAFECFSDNGLQKVLAAGDLSAPLSTQAPFYVLLEYESAGGADELAEAAFAQLSDANEVVDGVISQSLTQAQALWRLREDMSPTLHRWQPYKNDISVTISKMPAFIRCVQSLVAEAYPDFEMVWYGHVGDGNLHLNVLKPDALGAEEFVATCEQVSGDISALVREFGGSISAEHGIGLLKKPYLHYTRSAQDIALMKGVKAVFDPNGVMNPGKIFD